MEVIELTLRDLRKEKKLTQKELAEKCGLSQCYICALEQRRKISPSIITVRRLADSLGVNPTIIMEALSDEAM